ncbi:DUF6946 family protein [Carboxylicivirga marina]|uniref:DUF6946 family protein n=1 Tax=Carboxylicivirga marina TaxID=2800988 RepID=UPI002597DFDB|nr:hypothetical protein [uncultured Carboxylicivirga sp.]
MKISRYFPPKEIYSIDDWHQHCPPKEKDIQWKDYRSAKEMAKYWTSKEHQKEFLAFIQNVLPGISFEYAIPEYQTAFDNYRNPRQNDLVIFALYQDKKVLVSIEGKADEPYGSNLVKEELEKARKTFETKPSSNKLERVKELVERFDHLPELLNCCYQLLTWLSGSIEEAKRTKIDTIVLISQEFHSNKTTAVNIERNTKDLNRFVNLISNGSISEVRKNEICAPFLIDGVNCYFGKHVTNLK